MFMINYDEIMVLNGCVKLATMKGTEQPFSTLSEEQLHTALHHFSVSEFQLKEEENAFLVYNEILRFNCQISVYSMRQTFFKL